ncbi:MAG TPA: hypothetical protein DCP92_16210 [Nitrospiraceae bacterium]|nr:hypothetical protein [Nitrospiraceae bacterium]
MRLQLISLLQSIKELNEVNRVLIEQSLSSIKNTVNFLAASGLTMKQELKDQMHGN